MRIIPDSTINLYANVTIDNDEELVFSNKTNQTAYFNTKLVRSYVPCSMIKKTGRLRVEIPGSVISTCNYISFVNPSFDNKTIYARIIDYDYVNNECVEISYAIDYWQTWMFDVNFDDMYIEREHLSQADWEKAETKFPALMWRWQMLNKLRAKNKQLEQKYLAQDDVKNVALQRIISQLLKDDNCFLKISIERAYAILRELNVKPDMYEKIYLELTKPKN